MHQFDEHHPEFEGFSEFYAKEILPFLDAGEEMRLKAMSYVKRDVPLMLIGLGMLLAFLFWKFKEIQLLIMAMMGGGAGIAGYIGWRLKDVKERTKDMLVSNICRFVGWTFMEAIYQAPALDTLQENGLLPKKYDRVSFEDKMEGKAHGVDFEALECHMEVENKSDKGPKWKTVFRGSLMVLNLDRKFLGKTVVLRDKGFFNPKKIAGMKRVGLESIKFEKLFEAYGTDQVEARYLLTPDFIQRLIDLETSVDGKNVRFAFLDGLLAIAIETPNRFEAGSMFKPLSDMERTQNILNEIGAVYNLVDGIAAPRSFA